MTTKNVEQPKAAVVATETVTRATAVPERQYKLKSNPSVPPKGKQRQIVLAILNEAKKPLTIAEMTPLADGKGLVAIGGTGPSVRYHLHHLVKLGIAEVVNATRTVEVKKAAEKAA